MTHRFIVLATDYNCYMSWCSNKNLNPHGSDVVFVTSSHHLRGLDPKNITIILVDEWTANLTATGLLQLTEQIEMYRALGAKVVQDVCH